MKYKDTKIQGYKNTRIQGYKETRLQEYKDILINTGFKKRRQVMMKEWKKKMQYTKINFFLNPIIHFKVDIVIHSAATVRFDENLSKVNFIVLIVLY